MAQSNDIDLPSVIFNFLKNMPTTIKTDVLLSILVYGAQVDTSVIDKLPISEYETATENYLFRANALQGIGSVICSAAVLDYQLESFVAEEAEIKEIARITAPIARALEVNALGLPLRARHYRQALSEWRELRATVLTVQTILDFEKRSLRQ
jgi:hypothetical protein